MRQPVGVLFHDGLDHRAPTPRDDTFRVDLQADHTGGVHGGETRDVAVEGDEAISLVQLWPDALSLFTLGEPAGGCEALDEGTKVRSETQLRVVVGVEPGDGRFPVPVTEPVVESDPAMPVT